MPALLNITWTAPNCSSAYSASAFTSGSAVVLQIIVATSAPVLGEAGLDVAQLRRVDVGEHARFIPSAINASATARPMPLAPPVMTATFPGAMRALVAACESDIAQI